jgi:hypothetical protein
MLGRALTVSRGIVVTIRSVNRAAKKVFTFSYPPKQAKNIKPGDSTLPGDATNYFYNVPNLTQEKCVQYAQAKYNELIKHEMTCEFEIPGTDKLDTTGILKLSGTRTAWDQTYFPDSIKRSFSWDGGYTLDVTAKNHAPDSQNVT